MARDLVDVRGGYVFDSDLMNETKRINNGILNFLNNGMHEMISRLEKFDQSLLIILKTCKTELY